MGLDNVPEPKPCDVLFYPNAPGEDCSNCRIECPFRKLNVVRGIAATCCAIRGRRYDIYVEKIAGYSLYEPLTLDEIKDVYSKLKGFYEKFASYLRDDVKKDIENLVKYFELLINEVEKYPDDLKKQFVLKPWW